MALNESLINIGAAYLNATSANIAVTEVKSRFLELVTAPYHYSELLWITIPLVLSLLFMSFYFGRYKGEELGWNTAVGNSLALIFVAMDLFRHIYHRLADPSFANMILQEYKAVLVVFILALWGLWLFAADFFHVLPKRFAFLISSSIPITLSAYMAIILTYTDIPLDKTTLSAVVVLALVLIFVIKVIKFLMPVSLSEE